MHHTKISDIPVNCFETMDEAVQYIAKYGQGKIAVAINPEKILASLNSENVREVLLDADIRYLDGIGAVKIAESKLRKKLKRIPGCELWEALMVDAGSRARSVYLLGADYEVVNKTKIKLEKDYGVNVVGFSDGYFKNDDEIIKEILLHKPDILTVAMGSPRQELFMSKCRSAGLCSFMMGVGGTYNVFVGVADRAPIFWCQLGLEWLYRLLKEPSRFTRQAKLLKFIWLAFRKKL